MPTQDREEPVPAPEIRSRLIADTKFAYQCKPWNAVPSALDAFAQVRRSIIPIFWELRGALDPTPTAHATSATPPADPPAPSSAPSASPRVHDDDLSLFGERLGFHRRVGCQGQWCGVRLVCQHFRQH
jgi:hypothetical protein